MKKRNLVIVGGGSAGWMTASYLNGALNNKGETPRVNITLVESPNIPRISVGEATIPSMRHLLAVVGVDELDFMRATQASFKQSIKYVNWVNNDHSFYHHPFSRLTPQPLDNSAEKWLQSDQKIPFMETCSIQPLVCEMGLAPKALGQTGKKAPLQYAYHMNAQKFADYLTDFSTKRGVKHIFANLESVEMKDSTTIKSVLLDNGDTLEADLFVDCTGAKALLIEKQLDVGFEDCSQWLLCDRAVTMHVPYDTHYPGMVRPYTTATALSNGWVWDIPMRDRRSVGYVHSSQFISEEDAKKELIKYQGENCEDLDIRTVNFKVGRREQAWKGNCVAIGLSAGFVEPLESTGLYLSDLGVVALAEHFPFDDAHNEVLSTRYNRILSNRYYEILDFINMHYCLSKRDDTAFWKEVQKPEHINPRLKAKLAYWTIKPPTHSDFEDGCFELIQNEVKSTEHQGLDIRQPVDTGQLWNHQSYQCILFGMGFWQQEAKERFGENRPKLNIHNAIIEGIYGAKSNLPPHVKWLQAHLGMKTYSPAYVPHGWRLEKQPARG
ncbi:tryptophan halogenase family protein [Glaciecola sp. 2405UD65-10]|uniref:tryptophan halogenase family protein n=1 Tax=Glaciecola sp. 2405UD65-10 TaxID=3397244 RepID=UPI003B59021F